jgi:oligoendopeptidase F
VKLPDSSAGFAAASWTDVLPFYDALASADLDAVTVDHWLRQWSRLEELVGEAASRAMIAYTCDTGDPDKEAAHLRFSTDIIPKAEEQGVRLARRLVELGVVPDGLETTIARFRASIDIFRESNVPLFAELEELGSRYHRITGGMMAQWEGEPRPLPQLAPFLQSTDRQVRERAFRATVAPYVASRTDLAELFTLMVERRQAVARNANFSDYQTFSFAAKHRFDYTPGDCARFHDAVESVVVPAHTRALATRRDRLGVEVLRPWDTAVEPLSLRSPPAVHRWGRPGARVSRIFDRVDPALGAQFHTMVEENLLDLDSRKGKAPGGYCDTLHVIGPSLHLHEFLGRARGRDHDAPRGGPRVPLVRGARAAPGVAAPPGRGGGRARLDEYGAPGGCLSWGRRPGCWTSAMRPSRGSSTWKTSWRVWCTSPPSMRSRPGSTPAAWGWIPTSGTRPGSGSGRGSSRAWTGPA